MTISSPQVMLAQLNGFIQPWHAAIADPAKTQQQLLPDLLAIYAQTRYGEQHNANHIGSSMAEFRKCFPVATYLDYRPLIERVMGGEIDLLLNEPPVGWAITRGTTRGEVKFIPMTPADLRLRVSAGRAMINLLWSPPSAWICLPV